MQYSVTYEDYWRYQKSGFLKAKQYLSLTIFPFVAKPLVSKVLSVDDSNFMEFMNQRKKLIPEWIMNQLLIK